MGEIFCKGKAKVLKSIIEKWEQLNRQYCNKNKGKDALYWYNERASLSTLAGAIWRSSGIALEEFSSEKKARNLETTGRTDLWFKFKNKEYLIEAKQSTGAYSLVGNKGFDNAIMRLNKDACHDAVASLPNKKYLNRIGIFFYVPYFRKENISLYEQSKNSLIRNLKKWFYSEKSVFFACCFPSLAKNLFDRKDCYPGVVLIGKFI